jgi:hypothetical protein
MVVVGSNRVGELVVEVSSLIKGCRQINDEPFGDVARV